MKNLFTKGYIETRIQEGEFGEYLKAPMTNIERSAAVGRKMLLCRKKAGLSQSEVCAIIGIAPQTYSGYENGKHEPTIETLVRLSFLYCVSLDFLLDRNNGDDDFNRLLEGHENIAENKNIDDLRIQFQLMQQDVAELKKKIN